MPCKNAIKKTPRKKAAQNERRKATSTKAAAAGSSGKRKVERKEGRERRRKEVREAEAQASCKRCTILAPQVLIKCCSQVSVTHADIALEVGKGGRQAGGGGCWLLLPTLTFCANICEFNAKMNCNQMLQDDCVSFPMIGNATLQAGNSIQLQLQHTHTDTNKHTRTHTQPDISPQSGSETVRNLGQTNGRNSNLSRDLVREGKTECNVEFA